MLEQLGLDYGKPSVGAPKAGDILRCPLPVLSSAARAVNLLTTTHSMHNYADCCTISMRMVIR